MMNVKLHEPQENFATRNSATETFRTNYDCDEKSKSSYDFCFTFFEAMGYQDQIVKQ